MKWAKANLNQVIVDQVKCWDGKDDLQEEDDDMQGLEDTVETPPERVLWVYEEATPTMHTLQRDPTNTGALHHIRKVLNGKIREENKQHGIPEANWVINEMPFTSQYTWASKRYEDLERHPDDNESLEKLAEIKAVLDEIVFKHHYPENWSIPADFVGTAKVEAAERKRKRDEATKMVEAASQKAAVEAAKRAELAKKATATASSGIEAAPTARITYPWPTHKMDDGTLIVGYRRRGENGLQLCVEVEDNGRITRRLEPGGEVGLLDAKLYRDTPGSKDLAKCDWSCQDRDKFEELLWVAPSKRRSIYGNCRDPNADCCVKFKNGDIQMGNVSKFCKLLGRKSAEQQIEKVCHRDGVTPPWEAEIITESNDPRTERRRRRESRIEKALNSSGPLQDANGAEEQRKKVSILETQLGSMSQRLDKLFELMAKSSAVAGS